MSERHRIAWHPGFYGGIEFDLRKYRDILVFEQEHELSKESLRMDMLIIKKRADVEIDNLIGRIFRGYNIVEYKSPYDDLSIDDLYKVVGYAALYKGLGARVNEIPADDMSISVFRAGFPRKLMAELDRLGIVREKVYDGIYYVRGIINVPMQIVVTSELSGKEGAALKVLTPDANRTEVESFLEQARDAVLPGDRMNADAVLQVSVAANRPLYDRIREETEMCDALRELMKEEMAAEKAAGRAEGSEETLLVSIQNLMKNMSLSAKDAMKALGISPKDQKRYLAML